MCHSQKSYATRQSASDSVSDMSSIDQGLLQYMTAHPLGILGALASDPILGTILGSRALSPGLPLLPRMLCFRVFGSPMTYTA